MLIFGSDCAVDGASFWIVSASIVELADMVWKEGVGNFRESIYQGMSGKKAHEVFKTLVL